MQSRWSQWLLQLPVTCEVCGTWPSKAVCPECMARWCTAVDRCCRCAAHTPKGVELCGACLKAAALGEPALHRCIAAVDYTYPWQQLMARFKFQAEPGWADFFSTMLLQAPGAAKLMMRADALIAIPASRQRLAERGYNQAWLLAKALSRQWHSEAKTRKLQTCTPELIHGLERRRDTAAQHRLSRRQRLGNLDGAFEAGPDLLTRLRQGSLTHVILIDDVTTTGTTLHSAARTLRKVGVEQVSALVVCKT